MRIDMKRPPLTLRLKTRRKKFNFNLGETSGMPMWFGANDEPR